MSAIARLGLISGLLLETMVVWAQEGQVDRAETSAPAAARLPATGACCRCSVCTVETEQACWELGGAWQGENTTCDPSPCVVVYCAPGAQVCDEYISRVQIGAIDNPTGCEDGQYADYTYDVTGWAADTPMGVPTSLVVTNGNPIWTADVCSAWIDWNHDCLFDDVAPEALGDLSGVGPYDFSITVPDTALLGPARLRIRIDYANADPQPCGITQYGEVEDYTVVVVELTGACCWPDGACTLEMQSSCGGYWHGPGTQCAGTDCDHNGVDDACQFNPWCSDADQNGVLDICDPDCDGDGIVDACELPGGCDVGQCDYCYPYACGTGPDCNGNGVLDACDIANGTSQDCNLNGIPDECDIAGGPVVTAYDDGSSEDSLGNGSYNHEICWIHHFTVPGPVKGVATTYGTPAYPGGSGVSGGQTVHVWVWDDPNGDGDPTDTVLVSAYDATVDPGAIDTDVFQTITLPSPVAVGASFFVGVSHTGIGFEAPMDENGPLAHESWALYTISPPIDPTNFASILYNMDDIGFPCNWLLRVITQASADCNGNGVPDECDIADGASCDCQGDGIPDECQLGYNDCNADGIPDECDVGVEWGGYCADQGPPCFPSDCAVDCSLSGDPCLDGGDINNDGLVNMDDYWTFIAAFGTCRGQPGYNASADIDGDGCITLVDYQMWRCYYAQANGKDFVPPKPKPMPVPPVAR